MQLRPYQQTAVDALYRYLRNRDGNPVIVAPTGSGKSLIISQIATDAVTRWQGRVLVLAHRQELLEQNADKIRRLCSEIPVGLFSSGLGKRDTNQPVICAGIQSVYKRACEFEPFDLAIVDEGHLLSGRDDSMYGRFLSDARVINPQLRLIGLTATPFRLDSGLIYGPDRIFGDICYEIPIRQLLAEGFLCPLVSKSGVTRFDTTQLHVRGGEFVSREIEDLMDADELVEAACSEIVELTRDRNTVLIFAAGVEHGRHVQRILQERHDVECGFVCGETPSTERDETLSRFARVTGNSLFEKTPLKFLVNVSVLTTGYDCPRIDCVVLLRPTMSPGLLSQMAGRGFRLHESKKDCLVLDYGGNILRHGPIDQISATTIKKPGDGEAPAKECPECSSLIATGYTTCPDCGYEFPPPEKTKHEAEASTAGVLSGQVSEDEFDVHDVVYHVHTKRGADESTPKTMRVEYRLGLDYWVSEWVCFEHTGYARQKAIKWWRKRSADPVPDSAQEAVDIANAGGVAAPEAVVVRSVAGEKYDRIARHTLGPIPEPVDVTAIAVDLEEVPF